MHDFINIVIPVYNEGENIGSTIAEISKKIKTPYAIYIIYDFDEDNTLPVVRRLAAEMDNIFLVRNRYGKGVLNAIKTGFETVDDGIVLVVMADLSDDLGRVDGMVKKLNEGYDLVCGSRYMKKGRQIGGPRFKKMLSRLAGVSLHYVIGIPTHDITNSFKLYTKKVLNDIEIESDGGFELGMEIVIKAYLKGYRVTEVPCVWRDRGAGVSKFQLGKWLPKYMHWYLYAVKNRLSPRTGRNDL